MSQVEEILNGQIKIAEKLLQRAEAIPDGEKTVAFVRYDEKVTRPLADDVDAWEVETTEIIRTLFGENARQVAEFHGYVSNKNRYFDFRKDIQSELKKCISYLRSLVRVGEMKQRMPMKNNGKSQGSNTPKVFISHSSSDKGIIGIFVEKVLQLGLGPATGDIAYTSEESMGVEPGEDIPRYIKENIKDASIVLLMISPNYKKSEVCLNEMGAAWALERKCISVLLPNADFTQLGWLTSFKSAIQLNSKNQLLLLCEKIARELLIDLNQRFNVAASKIDDFLNAFNLDAGEGVVEHKVSTNADNSYVLVRDAINKLGEFTIKELQKETGINNYRYIAGIVSSMVRVELLDEVGSKSRRRYQLSSSYNHLNTKINE